MLVLQLSILHGARDMKRYERTAIIKSSSLAHAPAACKEEQVGACKQPVCTCHRLCKGSNKTFVPYCQVACTIMLVILLGCLSVNAVPLMANFAMPLGSKSLITASWEFKVSYGWCDFSRVLSPWPVLSHLICCQPVQPNFIVTAQC